MRSLHPATMHAQKQSLLRRPLTVFFLEAGIAKAINIEYNTTRATKAEALASWAACQWPEQLGHLADDSGRYTVHEAAFHEVSPQSCSECVHALDQLLAW
jgi:hypothetical protein